ERLAQTYRPAGVVRGAAGVFHDLLDRHGAGDELPKLPGQVPALARRPFVADQHGDRGGAVPPGRVRRQRSDPSVEARPTAGSRLRSGHHRELSVDSRPRAPVRGPSWKCWKLRKTREFSVSSLVFWVCRSGTRFSGIKSAIRLN